MPDNLPYNLIDERWIPVRRRSGTVEMIAPAEITDRGDPPLAVQSARPDFDGALLEFLIGLVQTAAAPKTDVVWGQRFDKPPGVAALKTDFETVREAFVLNGDGPRFMQDLTVSEHPDARELPVGALLIDRVGESELDESPTLFAKPGGFEALGYPAVAAALMAMQSYAPAGGRGQLTSLRAGGPLTTVVLGEDLWSTVWLNVLPQSQFEKLPGDATKLKSRFPWMTSTRTSETKGGKATHPQDVHPAQHYWGLPRRFRLDIDPSSIGTCSVTGQTQVPIVRTLRSRPDGTSYEGEFRHPLTSYKQIKPGEPWVAKRGSPDGLPYRDWPQLVTGGPERAPARVVAYFAESDRGERVVHRSLAAFGYATDKMKPLRWCKATTPLLVVPPERAEQFASQVEQLVSASEEVRRTLVYQVKAAWSDRPKDLPGDAPGRINPAFWSRTEPIFFASVGALCETADRAAGDVVREAWLVALHSAALFLFDSFAATTVELATADLGRVVLARRDLSTFTSPRSTTLRKALGLPVNEASSGDKPKRGKAKGKKENA